MAIYNKGTYLVVNKQLCLYFFAHFKQNMDWRQLNLQYRISEFALRLHYCFSHGATALYILW
jgi:hypothetical protein